MLTGIAVLEISAISQLSALGARLRVRNRAPGRKSARVPGSTCRRCNSGLVRYRVAVVVMPQIDAERRAWRNASDARPPPDAGFDVSLVVILAGGGSLGDPSTLTWTLSLTSPSSSTAAKRYVDVDPTVDLDPHRCASCDTVHVVERHTMSAVWLGLGSAGRARSRCRPAGRGILAAVRLVFVV